MLARSPSKGPLLIAAISGRALAAAARRAGYRPLVADMFCDSDMLALAERAMRMPGSLQAGIDGDHIVKRLKELAGKEEPLALVYGSGFESQPELLDELARHFPLAGNRGEVVRRVKDPQTFAAICSKAGIPHPEIRWNAPEDPENWIAKKAGAAGGSHVRHAQNAVVSPGSYFQRFIHGRSISALFIGDGRRARLVGFSRQWSSPTPQSPYRYGGAVRLLRFDRKQAARIGEWLSTLTAHLGLTGLCSADFIQAEDNFHLVEINPRPGATLDLFDSTEAPLLDAHIDPAGGMASRLPRWSGSTASMIVYASRPIERFPALDWPDWVSDRQLPGTRLLAGDPVCTAFAHGANAAAARRTVNALAKLMQSDWDGVP
ncbi:putative ATP-grasp superfamily ATP-dependent carboligase [Mesorhizobium sp. J18]|nr:putative ATP-grasp superfamily ATP-dependent carboligase [Mesorhizobium sp. J18]